MTIEKLKNGSYRIRMQHNGRRYSKTLPYKPSQKEAVLIMSELCQNSDSSSRGSMGEYIDKYIQDGIKRELSPSTINSYKSIKRNLPDWFLKKMFFEINQNDLLKVMTEYAAEHSKHTTDNAKGLVRSVFAHYRPAFAFPKISTPKTKRAVNRTTYEPTTDEIMKILDHASGTRYHVALQLLCLGLRRGELIALELTDLSEDNMLTIDKALALGDDGGYHLKGTKTEESKRIIEIPVQLASQIREQGYVFHGNPHTINEYLHKCQDKLQIERFNLHILRHFSAAYLLSQGWDPEAVREWHGWKKGSQVMNRVYDYNLDGKKKLSGMAQSFGKLLDGEKEEKDHKKTTEVQKEPVFTN